MRQAVSGICLVASSTTSIYIQLAVAWNTPLPAASSIVQAPTKLVACSHHNALHKYFPVCTLDALNSCSHRVVRLSIRVRTRTKAE